MDRDIWTERMLAAQGSGVEDHKWFSLIDKVYRHRTLQVAWQQVKANKGAAGIVHAAVKRVIEPIFDKEFLPMSYGFRPGKSYKVALREVDNYWLEWRLAANDPSGTCVTARSTGVMVKPGTPPRR